jgi:hypothetical protein
MMHSRKKGFISNSSLILIAYATAFFPRFLSSFGAPDIINFFHFIVVPAVSVFILFTVRTKTRSQISLVWDILIGMFLILLITIISAIVNQAGIPNIALQYLFQTEAFLFLAAMLAVPISGESFLKLKEYVLKFALCNLVLALAQSVLLPIGLYPKPAGGTIQDNITGVFGGGGGSAANYVSCTVSFYFALYFFLNYKFVPRWIRIALLLSACYQVQVSDSKQIFMALALGYGLLLLTKVKDPLKLCVYVVAIVAVTVICSWALLNLKLELLQPYQNWINRDIWGFDGLAARTKFAAFRILPSYFTSPLNWLIGLGPGHTVTRLGGWVMRDYQTILVPLGATIHPASQRIFDIISISYLPRESTVYFPLYTWAGIWGDIGIVGLSAYLYLCSIVWRRVCVDDFGKFMLLSTAILGCILTQMEEPGQMLTIACLLSIRWHEEREKKQLEPGRQTLLKPDEY